MGRLVPDHKTIADFRKANGVAIRRVCARFVALCRRVGLLSAAGVAIDGSKFKAVNNRDRNVTKAKMARRLAQVEESITRYPHQLDSAGRQDPTAAIAARVDRLNEKIGKLAEEMRRLRALESRMLASPDAQILGAEWYLRLSFYSVRFSCARNMPMLRRRPLCEGTDMPNSENSNGFKSARVETVDRITNNVTAVSISVDGLRALPDFQNGQHIVLRIEGGEEAADILRSYSLSVVSALHPIFQAFRRDVCRRS